MRRFWIAVLLLLAMSTHDLSAREWTDRMGKFRMEADVVAVKNGKAYLEKPNGDVIAVDLKKLSRADVEYLKSLPEYGDYFNENPTADSAGTKTEPKGEKSGKAGAKSLLTISGLDANKAGEIRRFKDQDWKATSLAFSPDGVFLAAGGFGGAGAVRMFNVASNTRTASVGSYEQFGKVSALAFTPDGTKLLSGGDTGRIQVWNVGEGGTLTEGNCFVGHSNTIHAIAISQDGKLVLSGGLEKNVRCWELETGRACFTIDGFQNEVKTVYITKSGKQGLASDGETLRLIDMKQGKTIQAIKVGPPLAITVAISPDGLRIAVDSMYNLMLRDIRSGRVLPPLEDKKTTWSAVFLSNGKHLLAGGDGKVNLWDVAKQRKIREFDTVGLSSVHSIAISPDNRHFAAASGAVGDGIHVLRLPAEVAP